MMLGIAVIALFLFFLGWFLAPVLLMLMVLLSYTVTSYDSLLDLDKELTARMQNLFVTLQLGSSTVTESAVAGSEILKGFTPVDEMRDAQDMLTSLVEVLDGEGGLLILRDRLYQYGSAQESLAALAREAMNSTQSQAQGRFPHHLAKVLVRNRDDRGDTVIGALALALPAPPPPHLDELIDESASSFVQLAKYRQLRSRTTTMADTIWPWQTQSSMDKIEAISVIADLLTTERSWLGTLLETLPQAVFITSPYGFSIYKNAAARRLFGDERHMLKAIPQVLKIDAAEFQQDYVRTVEQAESLELGTTERASDRPVMLTLKVVMVDNRVRGVAGLVSDLSKIEALNRQRQEMISMVVHDLRSPLTSIMGFSEFLLEDDSISEDVHEVLRIINEQSGRMKRLTDEVLEYSRLESGQVNPDFVVENVVEILRHVVASVSPQASEKKMSLSISAPDFVAVKLDHDLMSRVLTNLLSNAVKYSPENTRVTCKLYLDADDYIIEVIDQGFGIPEAQLHRLFGKYQRIEDGPHAAVEGTGLGLYLVKLIVEAHQGSIEVSSRVNEGSVFKLTLPLDPEGAHS
jgi:signal transduction histidine kinase